MQYAIVINHVEVLYNCRKHEGFKEVIQSCFVSMSVTVKFNLNQT